MDRNQRTHRILTQTMPPDKATDAMRDLETRVTRALGGLPVNADLFTQAIELASQIIPAPAGYRWEADVQEGHRLSLYVVSISGIPEGYRFAARVTIGFDGGNHDLRGDLWACTRCAAVIFPDGTGLHDRFHDEVSAAYFT